MWIHKHLDASQGGLWLTCKVNFQLLEGMHQGVVLWLLQGEIPKQNLQGRWSDGASLPSVFPWSGADVDISSFATAGPIHKHSFYQCPKTRSICSQNQWMVEAKTTWCLHTMYLTLEINTDGHQWIFVNVPMHTPCTFVVYPLSFLESGLDGLMYGFGLNQLMCVRNLTGMCIVTGILYVPAW